MSPSRRRNVSRELTKLLCSTLLAFGAWCLTVGVLWPQSRPTLGVPRMRYISLSCYVVCQKFSLCFRNFFLF